MTELTKSQLLDILKNEDTKTFREIVNAPDDAHPEEILESLHLVRMVHKGISRKLRRQSAKWLEKNGVIKEVA